MLVISGDHLFLSGILTTLFTDLHTITIANSSQLFPNLEATCNILIFLSFTWRYKAQCITQALTQWSDLKLFRK